MDRQILNIVILGIRPKPRDGRSRVVEENLSFPGFMGMHKNMHYFRGQRRTRFAFFDIFSFRRCFSLKPNKYFLNGYVKGASSTFLATVNPSRIKGAEASKSRSVVTSPSQQLGNSQETSTPASLRKTRGTLH